MVKKLFKHEFSAYLRILLPIYAILLVIAVFGRITFAFKNDTVVYNIIYGSSCALFGIAAFTALLFSAWYGVIRFYKNLFSGEGYLSFTLPVTPAQHLWVKSTTAVTCGFCTTVVIFLSLAIFTKGPLIAELWKAADYALGKLPAEYNDNVVIIAIEIVVLLLVSAYSSYFMYYSCITIGQLAKKNRVLAAIGVYFGYYVITQIISTILMIILAFVEVGEYEEVEMSTEILLTGYEVLLFITLFITALLGFIYFIISRHIMTKRLNLE